MASATGHRAGTFSHGGTARSDAPIRNPRRHAKTRENSPIFASLRVASRIETTTMRKYIPVAEPALVGNERAYVLDCLDSTWISSRGAYIDRFERAFAEFCGVGHAIACSSGTAALHLALLA